MRKRWFICPLIAGVLLLAACGSGDFTEKDYLVDVVYSNIAQTVAIQENTLPARTLTVLAPNIFSWEIRQADIRMRYIAENHLPEDERFHLDLDVTYYYWQDWEEQLQRLQIRMMAGDNYDLFFWDGHPLWHYVQAGFLVDFYTLIDADLYVSREDFFLNPLEALEIDGGLYALPMSFGLHYAFINATLPEHLVYQFSQYDTITLSCLMDIYIELQQNYSHEFGHLSFFGGSPPFASDGPNRVMASYMTKFIDMDNRTANLMDDRFINFLHRHRQVFAGWNPVGNVYCVFFRGTVRERVAEDAFWIASSELGAGFAINPEQMVQSYFLYGIPIADANGRLIISPEYGFLGGTLASVCITAGDNVKLAWEFTKHLINIFDFWNSGHNQYYMFRNHGVSIDIWHPHSLKMTTPILRELYVNNWTSALLGRLNLEIYYRYGMQAVERDIETAISRLRIYNEMPMAMAFPFIPEDLGAANIELFYRGVISAEVLAQRLQNSISIWLLGG